jgi:hypothetical protein
MGGVTPVLRSAQSCSSSRATGPMRVFRHLIVQMCVTGLRVTCTQCELHTDHVGSHS